MTTSKTYKVANPRNIPQGIYILRFEDSVWHEGDDFVKPVGMEIADVDRWVGGGFLVEVAGG